ncbi:hypothetical protein MCU_01581 [Bartonella elizabethae Re6043vi]|uniref:Uncharacterized protein n=2 Tax=Bartonella elizabethae TaxID=807 RepID=J0ZV88_BAREL|nr:hypothetical protein [Bartonella elizabethae]EJF82261.1 hypothetical protein MCU_01581 [Bartonella elizabethae Re6043vi]EJF92843.1 hypothetical protein MEE_01568 [Bartonella elizabethae F9251 = ATCC 49927]VEJ41716.1 Uncharacterised protein [Bartonella elizabethae]
MFKIFKNRVCSFTFTLLILFFVQIIEGNASFVKDQFQGRLTVAVSKEENNAVIKVLDRAAIYSFEEQDGVAFGRAEKVSAYSGNIFWGGIGVFSLFASLCVGDIVGTVVSLLGIFCTLH